jgi:hypothetical protein
VERGKMKRQILVHDDESKPIKLYTRRLQSLELLRKDFDVSPLEIDEFRVEMKKLIQRQRMLRNRKRPYPSKSRLDEADIFIVDFDLLKSMPDANWTSEVVAYLCRCFSRCGLIIGLNMPPIREFDLTLTNNVNSYVDVHVVSNQLDNPGLWMGTSKGFRPWYWPSLVAYLETFQKRLNEVANHLDDPLCEVIGIQHVIEALPRSVSEFIGIDPLKTTFRQFLFKSSHGLGRKDKNPDKDTLYRIAASRLSKWLEWQVLAGQNIVVDAPHLVERYPSLLKGNSSSVETWNKTATFGNYDDLGLRYQTIEEFRLKKSYWFSRPVWFWRALSEEGKIEEVSEPWKKKPARYRFCEDASRFYDEKLCKRFSSGVDSPYDRRFVKHFPRIDYQPRVRILMA